MPADLTRLWRAEKAHGQKIADRGYTLLTRILVWQFLNCAERFDGVRPRSCRFGLPEQQLEAFLGVYGKSKVWGRAESGSFAAALQSASRSFMPGGGSAHLA